MKETITYKEISLEQLEEYDKIPFWYETTKKYELKRINDGLGDILLELVDIPYFYKNFEEKVNEWKKIFDLTKWKFFAAYNSKKEMIAGCIVAVKTINCTMLEKRDDLAVIWDLRVSNEYKHKGIGQRLFDMAKDYAIKNNFKQLKVECQNTNPAAVNFYHKQGMKLCAINEYAYKEYPNEAQLLWYLDL